MVTTIFAAILDSSPQLHSKPSDILGMAIMGGLFLFALWVCYVVGKNFQAFMKGILWILALAALGVLLIVAFQAVHPGQ